MLELLGFTDSDHVEVITTADAPPASQPAPSVVKPIAAAPSTSAAPIEAPATVARLADVQTGENPQNTGVLVARLWEATSEHPPLGDDWAPTQAVEPPSRTFRWSFVSTALAITVTVALLAIAAYRWPINQAAELRQSLATSLTALETATALIPEAGSVVVDASQANAQLTGIAIPLLAFSDAANRAYTIATAEHGTGLPFVSSAPIDRLDATRLDLQRAADEALVIHEGIGDLLDYRILLGGALVLPDSLPIQATDAQISEIGVELADTLAATTEVLLQLPQGELLAEHRLTLEAAFAEMSADVADYLSALRNENQFAASRITGEMRDTVASMRGSLDSTLDAFDAWLDGAFRHLEEQLATTRVELQASDS